ncbi:MAG TPA: hypothetical protein VJ672_06415 [Gemmatimonadaceae bacterium]|nr:hypothetical protein [Gemmatimonadaceae bacterium]
MFSTQCAAVVAPLILLAACSARSTSSSTSTSSPTSTAASPAPATATDSAPAMASIRDKLGQYTTVRLTSDLAGLSDKERRMIPLLIDAAQAMDEIFWMEAYGDRQALLRSLSDADTRRYAEINYGPWDRLDDNAPFVPGVEPKPAGANFYPKDITKAEIEREIAAGGARGDSLGSQYTIVKRDGARLTAVPYHVAFGPQVQRAAARLREAAALADDAGLKRYLELRAGALLTDQYQPSDLAWMDMKNNTLEVVIGPIENYEDQLLGRKTAHEAFVLVKDREWSKRLSRYASLLPALQRDLPVAETYKREVPGTDSDLNAYDALYYAGDANAGSKSIAINLPNDEEVQLKKGTRRLQLKNAMRAKFDEILVPIAGTLIVDDQRKHVTFDAFFANVMFHEVAHGLGIKRTIDGKQAVREALKEQASWLEEGKADILGLYMVSKLQEQGELGNVDMRDYYVTFMASIFRSVRFGAASAHGRANMVRFNYFRDAGAFTRDDATGAYRVHFDKMRAAMSSLSEKILRLQGDGDYAAVKALADAQGAIGPALQRDLDRLAARNIPVDIVFEQGVSVLGAR